MMAMTSMTAMSATMNIFYDGLWEHVLHVWSGWGWSSRHHVQSVQRIVDGAMWPMQMEKLDASFFFFLGEARMH
jgi:hypothetical protein